MLLIIMLGFMLQSSASAGVGIIHRLTCYLLSCLVSCCSPALLQVLALFTG